MKKICFIVLLVGSISFTGCEALSKSFLVNSTEKSVNDWDGSGYQRSKAVGTGIDPQAREIEKRLGYFPE